MECKLDILEMISKLPQKKDATDSLISAVDDYIDEANDDDTSINRIKEIISAVESAVNNQETDLVF